ncbi:MAG: hypothetical protein KAJ01_07045 [Candidatus Hydrogenedentes bacterium]|nr:hypothetical protein [Candidatus Hydrogenedentota bacterium]
MFDNVIRRLKSRKDARLYERTFLRARKKGETCAAASTRLYCQGDDEKALAYEMLEEKFPELYTPGTIQPIDPPQMAV